jgi:hypothetical protein
MKMTQGRSFSQDFPTDIGNYIINETALKMTGFKDPIGKMFSMGTNEGELVGVVKDFHGTSLHSDIRPVVFYLYQNLPYFQMFVKIIIWVRPFNSDQAFYFLTTHSSCCFVRTSVVFCPDFTVIGVSRGLGSTNKRRVQEPSNRLRSFPPTNILK